MDKRILINHLVDPEGATPVAVLFPDGRIDGTDDPELLQAIQAALTDDQTIAELPDLQTLPGPASRYDPQSAEWAWTACAALVDRGLRGTPEGWEAPPGDPPAAQPHSTY